MFETPGWSEDWCMKRSSNLVDTFKVNTRGSGQVYGTLSSYLGFGTWHLLAVSRHIPFDGVRLKPPIRSAFFFRWEGVGSEQLRLSSMRRKMQPRTQQLLRQGTKAFGPSGSRKLSNSKRLHALSESSLETCDLGFPLFSWPIQRVNASSAFRSPKFWSPLTWCFP